MGAVGDGVALFVDEEVFAFFADEGLSVLEMRGGGVEGLDDELAGAVNEAGFGADVDAGEACVEIFGGFEFGWDDDLAGAVDIADFAAFADAEEGIGIGGCEGGVDEEEGEWNAKDHGGPYRG